MTPKLHTAERWLQQGRSIKVNEQPIKRVKKREKKDIWSTEFAAKQMSTEKKEDSLLEETNLYGEWQTEPYVPPVAQEVYFASRFLSRLG